MDQNIQAQIDNLTKRLDAFNLSSSIPFQVDKAWQNRGFIKTDFFVAGTGEIASNGEYHLTIPDSNRTSIALITPFPNAAGAMGAEMTNAYAQNNFGASSTQFDITNSSGTTFRYTYDGNGANPGINSSTLPIGSHVTIFSANFNNANQSAASRPFFVVTASGNNFFEVDNPTPGVAENNVTIGTPGSITGGPSTNTFELFVEGTATDQFGFVVFLFPQLFIQN